MEIVFKDAIAFSDNETKIKYYIRFFNKEKIIVQYLNTIGILKSHCINLNIIKQNDESWNSFEELPISVKAYIGKYINLLVFA